MRKGYVATAAGLVMGLATLQVGASTVVQDDFANGDNLAPEVFTGGSTASFWSSAGSESGGQLQFNLANTGSYTGATKSSVASASWDFFTQSVTMSVRGLTFTDTSINGKTFATNYMNTRFGFASNAANAWSGDDGITLNIRGDGYTQLWLSKDQPSAWGSTPWSSTGNISGITGFDFTLGAGVTGVDYTLTILRSAGSPVVVTGNLDITAADWSDGTPGINNSVLFIASQESYTGGIDGDQRYRSTIESFTISAIPTPAALPGGLMLLAIAAIKRRRRA